jgi:hypothetical protein
VNFRLTCARHKQVFSFRTLDYGSQLDTIPPHSSFDELPLNPFLMTFGNRRELKASTQFSVRNGKKPRHHWTFSKQVQRDAFSTLAQGIDSIR